MIPRPSRVASQGTRRPPPSTRRTPGPARPERRTTVPSDEQQAVTGQMKRQRTDKSGRRRFNFTASRAIDEHAEQRTSLSRRSRFHHHCAKQHPVDEQARNSLSTYGRRVRTHHRSFPRPCPEADNVRCSKPFVHERAAEDLLAERTAVSARSCTDGSTNEAVSASGTSNSKRSGIAGITAIARTGTSRTRLQMRLRIG